MNFLLNKYINTGVMVRLKIYENVKIKFNFIDIFLIVLLIVSPLWTLVLGLIENMRQISLIGLIMFFVIIPVFNSRYKKKKKYKIIGYVQLGQTEIEINYCNNLEIIKYEEIDFMLIQYNSFKGKHKINIASRGSVERENGLQNRFIIETLIAKKCFDILFENRTQVIHLRKFLLTVANRIKLGFVNKNGKDMLSGKVKIYR